MYHVRRWATPWLPIASETFRKK